MTKVVLKKAEVLKSVRPIVIQPMEDRMYITPIDYSNNQKSQQATLNLLMGLDDDDIHETKDNTQQENSNNLSHQDLTSEKVEEILADAKERAEMIVKHAEDSKISILESAETEKQQIIEVAQQSAEELRKTIDKEIETAQAQGKQEGLDKGYEEASNETKRLIKLLQTISVDLVAQKSIILDTIESDIVDLILMISNKVVKSITATYKQVVYDNVVAALKKLKSYNNIIVKVNPDDLSTIETHKAKLLEEINGIENFQLLEDPSIENGGCIIQSDFGSVDGRISSQLAEIEEQIRKISPIQPL